MLTKSMEEKRQRKKLNILRCDSSSFIALDEIPKGPFIPRAIFVALPSPSLNVALKVGR